MTKYLAISIGSIYDTMRKARKTRELWASSYLFSKLMEFLISDLESKTTILAPQHRQDKSAAIYGAGIFPDRLFALAKDLDDTAIEEIKTTVLKKITALLLPSTKKQEETQAIAFWLSYFRIVHVFVDLPAAPSGEVILQLNDYLDTQELAPAYRAVQPKKDYLLSLLDEVYKTDLSKALHQKGNYQGLMEGLFPSTADIATFELYQTAPTAYKELRASVKVDQEDGDTDDNLTEFYQQIFNAGTANEATSIASDYHKYFCIVHADGDSFGATINSLVDAAAIANFSEKLANYAADAADIVNTFGGKPVYIGGDDLLFLAPVRSREGTVFDLIAALDEKFRAYQFPLAPSLSFGLTLSYYKFPLFEARDLSYQQLFDRAKKVNDKNTVAFRFLKHSGSYFEGMLTKSQLATFNQVYQKAGALPEDFFSSIMFKLDTLKILLENLRNPEGNIPTDRLENLFQNFFNEPIHRQHQDQLKLVQELIQAVFGASLVVDQEPLPPATNLYALLRLLMFMNSSRKKTATQYA